jgi:hypothetical protein
LATPQYYVLLSARPGATPHDKKALLIQSNSKQKKAQGDALRWGGDQGSNLEELEGLGKADREQKGEGSGFAKISSGFNLFAYPRPKRPIIFSNIF